MAIYTQNQVRQFYVVNKVIDYQDTNALNAGEARLHNSSDGTFYLQYKGADGNQVRSDVIKKSNILNVQFTPAAKMARLSVATVVTLDSAVNSGNPIPGEDYLLNIRINQYCNPSDDNYIYKYGVARAVTGNTASVLYARLAISLAKNFSREVEPMLKFYLTTQTNPASTAIATQQSGGKLTEVTALSTETVLNPGSNTYTGIIIDEIAQDWHLGKMEQEPVMYEVFPDVVLDANSVAVTWGKATKLAGLVATTNGKKIADLEYFYHGERGDIYRGIGWPHVIETTLTANPTKTYDVIDIHYYTDLANHAVQKQEKDISIAIDTSASNGYKTTDFITDLNAVAGATVATYSATTPSHYTA